MIAPPQLRFIIVRQLYGFWMMGAAPTSLRGAKRRMRRLWVKTQSRAYAGDRSRDCCRTMTTQYTAPMQKKMPFTAVVPHGRTPAASNATTARGTRRAASRNQRGEESEVPDPTDRATPIRLLFLREAHPTAPGLSLTGVRLVL